MSKRMLLVAGLSLAVCTCWLVGSAFADPSASSLGDEPPLQSLMKDPNSSPAGPSFGAHRAPRDASCGTTTVTQNVTDDVLEPGSVACPAPNENSYARCFRSPEGGFLLECVDMGVQTTTLARTMDLAITVEPAATGMCAAIEGESWGSQVVRGAPDLITTVDVPAGIVVADQYFATHILGSPIPVPAGDDIMIEFRHGPPVTDDGMWVGSNNDGEIGGTAYLAASGCGIDTYTTVADVGFPDFHWVVRLGGHLLNAPGACCDDLPFPGSCTENVLQSDCLGAGQRFLVGTAQCDSFDPACGDVPTNDACEVKVILSHQSVCHAFDNTTATEQTDPEIPSFACLSGTFTQDLWFEYVVPAVPGPANTFGTLVISTIGSDFDTLLEVYDMTFQTQAQVCGGTGSAFPCNDNIDNTFNHLSYLTLNVMVGTTYKIRVGGNGPGQFGLGMLNIDYIPTNPPDKWFSIAGPQGVGRCCYDDGRPCEITNYSDQFGTLWEGCVEMGGYFMGETNFWEGIIDVPFAEFQGVGCCTLPCPDLGEACFVPVDLNVKLGGGIEGTVFRDITDKLYYKYVLPAAGTSIVFDTCNSDFDTVIEIYGGCSQVNSKPTPQDLPGVPNPLSQDGVALVNDDCIYGDDDQTAAGTRLANNCLSVSGQLDSCLCLTVEDSLGNGLDAGDIIIICIGAYNSNYPATSVVRSVDPVRDPLSSLIVRAVINVTEVPECFICEVDGPWPLGTPGIGSDEALENNCGDGVSDRANDGCSLPGAPATHDLNLIPPLMPTVAPVTWQIWGRSGVYIDSTYGQRSDEDWYEFEITEKVLIDVSMIAAEFQSEITLYRKGDVDACQTDLVVGATLFIPCVDWPAGFLQAEICAGSYYLVIKPLSPAKPDCATVPEYLAQIILSAATANSCCEGDVNNDGKVDGLDIQPWVDYFLDPPGVSLNGNAWDVCSDREYCAVDTDGDGSLTMADLPGFVTLLLAGVPCDSLSANCDEPLACQLPDQSGQTTSDKNPLPDTTELDIRTADNFLATETGNIEDLCWWGYGWLDVDGWADCGDTMGFNFGVTYWTSTTTAGGLPCPGTLVPECVAGALPITGVVRTDNGTFSDNTGFTEYKFTGSHTPVGVVAGECYWIEIANNTTGANCFFLWSYSGDGDGIIAQHQGAGDPTVYDCDTDLFVRDMAFCVDVHIAPNGCLGEPLVGACCLNAEPPNDCVMVTLAECRILYDWHSWDSTRVCGADCCGAALCSVVCEEGDVVEVEGCGFHKNDGCFTNPLGWEPATTDLGFLVCPTSVVACGESFSRQSTGEYDSDWWKFGTDKPTLVSFTFEAEFDPIFYVIDQSLLDCNDFSVGTRPVGVASLIDLNGDGEIGDAFILSPDRCESTTFFEVVLPAGNYIAVVEGNDTASHLCGDADGLPTTHYRMEIECLGGVFDVDPDCPPGGVDALDEPCNEAQDPDLNGGCNEEPGEDFLDSLACPETKCGTIWFDGATRDIDWYILTVPGAPGGAAQWVTLEFDAEFDLLVNVGASEFVDCDNDGLDPAFYSLSQSRFEPGPATLTQCFAPGEYLVLVTIAFPADALETTTCLSVPDPFGITSGPHYTITTSCGGDCSCEEPALNCQDLFAGSVVVSDVDAEQAIIDDFRPMGSSIDSLCWWGVYDDVYTLGFQDCLSPVADNFIVTFYGDDGASGPDAGNILATYTLSGADLAKADTGQTFNSAVIWEYSNVPPLALTVVAGECIWVEIKQDNSDCVPGTGPPPWRATTGWRLTPMAPARLSRQRVIRRSVWTALSARPAPLPVRAATTARCALEP